MQLRSFTQGGLCNDSNSHGLLPGRRSCVYTMVMSEHVVQRLGWTVDVDGARWRPLARRSPTANAAHNYLQGCS